MLFILVTFDVSKDDRSSEVRDEHLLNMTPILVTCDVSKDDKSSEVRDEQPLNILFILVTFDVLKFDRSSEVSDEQSRNMLAVLVTSMGEVVPTWTVLMDRVFESQGQSVAPVGLVGGVASCVYPSSISS